jgi:hypothetical protein
MAETIIIRKDTKKLVLIAAFIGLSFLLPGAFLVVAQGLGFPLTYRPGNWITHPTAPYVAMGIGGMALLTGAVIWLVFKTRLGAVVELNAEGLTHFGDFANRSLAWSAIERVEAFEDRVVVRPRQGGEPLAIHTHMLENSAKEVAGVIAPFLRPRATPQARGGFGMRGAG